MLVNISQVCSINIQGGFDVNTEFWQILYQAGGVSSWCHYLVLAILLNYSPIFLWSRKSFSFMLYLISVCCRDLHGEDPRDLLHHPDWLHQEQSLVHVYHAGERWCHYTVNFAHVYWVEERWHHHMLSSYLFYVRCKHRVAKLQIEKLTTTKLPDFLSSVSLPPANEVSGR